MNLYLIERKDDGDWDTYLGAVVAAENEREARNTHPDSDKTWSINDDTWVAPEEVRITLLATDVKIEKGVILSSFLNG